MKIGNGEFWLGDCLDLMQQIPDGSVDMVVTSPPYDDLRTYNGTNDWCFEIFTRIAAELSRVLTDGGVIVWNVGDATVKGSETGSSFRQALHFKDVCGLRLHDTMIWQKPTFSAVGALRVRYAPVFEYMFVLSKNAPKSFNPLKDRPCVSAGQTHAAPTIRGADGKIVVNKPSTIGEFGQRFNIWQINTVSQKGNGVHPAPFPVQLAHDHILSWTNPGDLVLDPFGGSGTTAVAAERVNRRWICIEREPSYYEAAISRVRGHVTETRGSLESAIDDLTKLLRDATPPA